MTSNLEQRLYRLEGQITAIQLQIAVILGQIAALAQQQYGAGGGFGGGGGSSGAGYCQLPSSLGPATGTWPSLTPTTASSVTVYTPGSGGSLSSAGSQTIYNFRDVTWAASKTTYLESVGGIWVIVDQDC